MNNIEQISIWKQNGHWWQQGNGRQLLWPVLDDKGLYVGRLMAVDAQFIRYVDESIVGQTISKITAARNLHSDVFTSTRLGGPPSTDESTREWLRRMANEPGTLLFMLEERPGTPVAHYGLFGITEHAAWFGSLLRFDKSTARGFIHLCEIAMMAFLILKLRIQTVWLDVLADNYNVIRMHERTGFFTESIWAIQEPISSLKDVMTRMQITQQRFLEVNSAIFTHYYRHRDEVS